MADGGTYKTNFWDIDRWAPMTRSIRPWSRRCPPVWPGRRTRSRRTWACRCRTWRTSISVPTARVNSGDEQLTAVQHAMPGLTNPYADQPAAAGAGALPATSRSSSNFPFGYVANDVNWYEGAGIPFSAFDDIGRENAYPLVRVRRRNGNTVLATVDTVLPISGEASCTNCHADPADVQNSRSSQPTDALRNAGLPVATSLDDPDARHADESQRRVCGGYQYPAPARSAITAPIMWTRPTSRRPAISPPTGATVTPAA